MQKCPTSDVATGTVFFGKVSRRGGALNTFLRPLVGELPPPFEYDLWITEGQTVHALKLPDRFEFRMLQLASPVV